MFRLASLYVSLLAAISLSGLSVAQSETVKFPASSTYNGKKVVLSGELNMPSGSGGKHPAVILLHGCGGLSPAVRSSLRSHASALRRNGFATLILDSFGPRNLRSGFVCGTIPRLAEARSYRLKDVKDAASYLRSLDTIDGGNLFIVGQSNGGSVTGLATKTSSIKGLRAGVAYYPWCGAISASPSRPLLVLAGAEDDWTPPEDCKRKDRPGGKLQVILYDNAVHSFDLPIRETKFLRYRVGGNKAATRDSRSRMVAFFKQHLR